jgi:ABC-2 type transport system ATP-binding protein
MRHLSSLTVEAELMHPPPDLSAVAGVSGVVVDGLKVRCDVTGPIEPLLDALTSAGVRRLMSREPSLEELFLAHYGDGAPETSRAA